MSGMTMTMAKKGTIRLTTALYKMNTGFSFGSAVNWSIYYVKAIEYLYY